nr:transcriptional regulator [Natrinema caseinilyticum]
MTLLDHNPEDEAAIPDDLTTDDEELEEMLMAMTHTHLPKLESLGLIEWNREKNVVTRGPAFDELRPLLELIDRHQDELPEGWL